MLPQNLLGFEVSNLAILHMFVQEIELRVQMCCSKCEGKVKDALRKVPGKIFTPVVPY